ncbi:YceI family protein [Cereibacter sphaeroides]|uniref:YceI family protein n=1 Tax=Cereibacter sphaeroides TaxID=1063 RepID=UPI001F212C2D|nr:YceI family protein [Cereibacter sphaeroides]MCE6960651.1 YceI family protein [Cereibacter sphaeroides]MCE6970082.1 YceI family protein [Cereibacter sphaeroides]MCE6973247.1 YceI family protein [Cereibacter sphaeroides]
MPLSSLLDKAHGWRRAVTCAALIMLGATAAAAAPSTYSIDPEGSQVQFFVDFGEDEISGNMRLVRADLQLDLRNPARSRVDVAVDASHATAGFPFATQAMRGPRILDSANHPLITFASKRVVALGASNARIDGDITIRAVTRPISLDAKIYRARDSQPGDLSKLTIVLTGKVPRSQFGATGWDDLVGDEVRLRILARIHRVD